MNVGSNCEIRRFERHSEVLLNWGKTVFVNTVYELFRRLFSYTRGKTSFVKTAVILLAFNLLYICRQMAAVY